MRDERGPRSVDRGRRRFVAGAAAVGAAAWIPTARLGPAEADGVGDPPGFPDGIDRYRQAFENWSGEIVVDDLWTCRPADADDVVRLAEWARAARWRLRPRGAMHGWSPICVSGDEDGNSTVVLLDTSGLGGMTFATRNGVDVVTCGAGVLLDDLHDACRERGLGVVAAPALGHVTVGGVLAIGGHGTAVPRPGEVRVPGTTFGTWSNLVTELEIVAWDRAARRYRRQVVDRSDPRIGALLVHLGRTFVTRATLQLGQNARLRCVSDVQTTAAELFAPPGSAGTTIERILDESGRTEVIWYAFTDRPWTKVWSVAPTRPASAREVTGPYNYPFSDNIPRELSDLARAVVEGNPSATPLLGRSAYAVTAAGLTATQSADLWGWSQDLQRYIRPETLRVVQSGHVVLTSRDRIQQVAHEFATEYRRLLEAYAARGQYPVSLGVELRFTSVDHPADVDAVARAKPVGLSPVHPSVRDADRRVAMWIDVLSFATTPDKELFNRDLERWLFEHFSPNDEVRVEWSKGWAYSEDSTWTDPDVLDRRIPDAFSSGRRDTWRSIASQLDDLDPAGVWRTSFHDRLLPGA